MADQRLPAVDPQLVEWLTRVFPDKCPDPEDTDREIWMAVGKQEVIKMLRARVNEQTEDNLTSG